MSKQHSMLNIVLKLTGPVEPVGETHSDNERFENLKELLILMIDLHTLVDRLATENKDRHEFSMSRAGKLCNRSPYRSDEDRSKHWKWWSGICSPKNEQHCARDEGRSRQTGNRIRHPRGRRG